MTATIVERAESLGVLNSGWRFIDYCFDAIPLQKWICAIIWGEKGNEKTETLLQDGYSIHHGFDEYRGDPKKGIVTNWDDDNAWDKVFDYLVLRPKKYAEIITKALDDNERIKWLGWDDINIHLPRSMYSTNRLVWETISKNWEGSRTLISVFECTAPRKDKVVSFILSDMNWDILNSGRKVADIRRWMWDRDFYEPERVNKASIQVEQKQIEELVPPKQWERYWKLRIETNSELTRDLIKTMHAIDNPATTGTTRESYPCPNCGREMGSQFNLKMHEPKCRRGRVSP